MVGERERTLEHKLKRSSGDWYSEGLKTEGAMFAAIGLADGREIVCGLGETPLAAEADAEKKASESSGGPHIVRTVPVGIEQYRQIQRGVLSADQLGLGPGQASHHTAER